MVIHQVHADLVFIPIIGYCNDAIPLSRGDRAMPTRKDSVSVTDSVLVAISNRYRRAYWVTDKIRDSFRNIL